MEKRNGWSGWLQWGLGILIALALGSNGFFISRMSATWDQRLDRIDEKLIANGLAIAKVESTPPTPEDMTRLWQAIADVRTKVVELPAQLPPPWFQKRVDRIEKNLDTVSARINDMSALFAAHLKTQSGGGSE